MKLSHLVLALLVVTAGIPASGAAEGGEPPLVDAGLDQSVVTGTTVYLDGGGSVDPDGEIVEYSWSIETPRGETTTPTDPDAVMTRFVVDQTGRYHVTLTVTDDDGNTRSDTLFVDVGGAVDTRTDSPSTGTNESASTPVDTGSPPSVIFDPTPGQHFRGPKNQEPLGQIIGPDSVRAGSSVRYVLQATDVDGRIIDTRWLSPSHSESPVATTDADSLAQTYTFDVEPGTEVRLPAVVVDDDNATSRVTKTVQVTNNPPDAMIHGNATVAVGSVHEYEVIGSDPDGPVTSYTWETDSPAIETIETNGLLRGSGATNRAQNQLVRFTEIPEDDATVTLQATVSDEHGGTTTVEKEVTVVQRTKGIKLNEPIERFTPNILKYEASQNGRPTALFGPDEAIPGRITFTAVATDNDSDRLTFEWEFGDYGTARTVETGERMRSEVSFSFGTNEIDFLRPVPVTVTITDQNGKSRTLTKELDFREAQSIRHVENTLEVSTTDRLSISGSVDLRPMSNGDEPPAYVKIYLGDGTVKTLDEAEQSEEQSHRYQFDYRYQSAGKYVVQVQNQDTITKETVSVGSQTYVEWAYEQKVTSTTKTVAASRPAGDGWARAGVDHVRYEKVDVETTRTRVSDGKTIVPGDAWKRVGTDVEYRTEQRTTRAAESPGSEWELVEPNVSERIVFAGWETKTVPSRLMANPDWEYMGKVATTTTETEIKESATRPSGSGWKRGSKTGDVVRTGYSTEWVTNRFLADSDWEYVESDRYISGYTSSTKCVEYADFRWGSYCIEKDTVRSANYDTRYKYRVPEYSAEYEWQRTVEKTTYDYEYRTKTYATKAVNEYAKAERVETRYATWQKSEYDETKVYKWEKTETRWEQTTSLSEPFGDVRNVEKYVRECGEDWDEGEPLSCQGDEP